MSETAAAPTPIHGLFSRIYHDIRRNRAQLPSMPTVAIRIRAAMQARNFSAESVARVIEADAGTSAYLIRIANSAVYRGRVPIKNVQTAVMRFGVKATRNLVTGYALRAMFTTRSRALAHIMNTTWRNGAYIAALSSVIAKRCPGFEPDQALLAGLLQDIGVLPLLHALENRRQTKLDIKRIVPTLEAFTSKIGVVLLDHWGFDDQMIEVARSRRDWMRDPSPNADLADLVLIARLHAEMGKESSIDQPLIDEIPAYSKLPLGELAPDDSIAMITSAENEVRNIMQTLGV